SILRCVASAAYERTLSERTRAVYPTLVGCGSGRGPGTSGLPDLANTGAPSGARGPSRRLKVGAERWTNRTRDRRIATTLPVGAFAFRDATSPRIPAQVVRWGDQGGEQTDTGAPRV